MSDTDCGCGKDKEIDYLQAERDRLIQEQRFVAEVADNRLKEIDRLKAELELQKETCKTGFMDRDLWKSRCLEIGRKDATTK